MRTITITEEDIKAGKRCSPCGCRTAIAARRTFGCPVHVGIDEIYLNAQYSQDGYDGSLIGYEDFADLPEDATHRIRLYDRTGHMEPFSFEIDIDGEMNR